MSRTLSLTDSTQGTNQLFAVCLKNAADAQRCAATAIENRNRARKYLYRLAVASQKLVKNHHEWFLSQAQRVGGIDDMLAGWFAPLALFGEDWRELLRDVAEGVTEAQYLASSAGSFTRRKKVESIVSRQSRETPIPAAPDVTLPAVDRIKALTDQNDLLRGQLAANRKEYAELKRIAARQEKRIGELEGVLNRVERDV